MGAAWGIWSWWSGRGGADLEFVEVGPGLDELKLEREVQAAERARVRPGQPGTPTTSAALWEPLAPAERAYYLSEDHVRKYFGLGKRDKDLRVYDPFVFMLQRPGCNQVMKWSEHPEGEILYQTNEAGLRDDPIDWEGSADLRVLVTGDSHTYGMCSNHESYPNVLEAQLTAAWPGRTFDVLNTGQGGWTFYHYLGMLEKYLDWEPDVFVVGVYGGNDFSGLAGLAHTFDESSRTRLTAEHYQQRREALAINPSAMGQCFTGAFHFEHNPQHVDELYAVSLDLIEQMRAVCEIRGIEMVVAFIPAPCDLAWDRPIKKFEELREFLDLGDDGLGVLDALATRFVDDVRKSGLPVVDLRDSLEGLERPPYWRRDQHLDLVGHEILARELQPVVEELARARGLLGEPDRSGRSTPR